MNRAAWAQSSTAVASSALRVLRKVGIGVAGGAVLLAGVALIVLPGPAVVVIPLGLAILAIEFPWARRLLSTSKAQLARLVRRLRPTANPG